MQSQLLNQCRFKKEQSKHNRSRLQLHFPLASPAQSNASSPSAMAGLLTVSHALVPYIPSDADAQLPVPPLPVAAERFGPEIGEAVRVAFQPEAARLRDVMTQFKGMNIGDAEAEVRRAAVNAEIRRSMQLGIAALTHSLDALFLVQPGATARQAQERLDAVRSLVTPAATGPAGPMGPSWFALLAEALHRQLMHLFGIWQFGQISLQWLWERIVRLFNWVVGRQSPPPPPALDEEAAAGTS